MTGVSGNTDPANHDDVKQRFYAVRYSPRADREIAEAAARLAEVTSSDEIALEWFAGIKAAALTLAENARRLPVDAQSSRRLTKIYRLDLSADTGPGTWP